ncbi:MAG: potassium channel protein [Acidimicrobiaceae bacterium]|jgi:voltage-gated potassium channel|nr:potassium channel protein [Acidimicrobiaceae bacterium]MDP6482071.1 potassium channel protein [Acidimicrobiales bacterium]|tara:strand:+ start:3282 stop:4292 length:1011 start_codon:yes stop_codon:yes gene_type:complete
MFRRTIRPARSRLANAAGLLLAVIGAGSTGYILLGLSPVDAVYQTIVTVSTVGFREIANGVPGTAWKTFTSVLILVGTGSMLYGASIVIESIVEGRITGQYRRFRMQRQIDDLSGHLIVCGMGRVGRSITSFVQSIGQTVVTVDTEEVRLIANGGMYVLGDATSDEVLRQAGIERAGTLVTALGSSVENLYVTLSAREMNPGLFIVSRADEAESITKLHQVGADRVVNPYEIGGYRMASLATQPNVADFVDVVVHDGTFEATLREFKIPPGCNFERKTIDELSVRSSTGAVVLTVRDELDRFHTDDVAQRPFAVGDVIVAIGSDESLERLARLVGC